LAAGSNRRPPHSGKGQHPQETENDVIRGGGTGVSAIKSFFLFLSPTKQQNKLECLSSVNIPV
jgi:hypothetical protein